MHLSIVALLSCVIGIAISAAELPIAPLLQTSLADEPSQESSHDSVYSLAIIGAGIAGSVAAFEARNVWDRWSHRTLLNITVFEAATRPGGRVKSVIQFDGKYDQAHYADAGAKWIHENDECMMEIIESVGLRKHLTGTTESAFEVGIWDGSTLRLRTDSQMRPRTWADKLKLALEFGRHVYNVQKRVADAFTRLSHFWMLLQYDYGTLAANMRRDGVDELVRNSASQLADETSSKQYADDILEPLLRSRHSVSTDNASQLALLDALGSSGRVCFSGVLETMQSVIDRLLILAKAEQRLGSQVRRIERANDDKYSLDIGSDGSAWTSSGPFDGVIIAAPLSTAAIEVLGAIPETSNKLYEQRHITLFAIPSYLSPAYFNLSSERSVPEIIYTAHSDPELPFLTIERSLTDKGFCGDEPELAYLYRVTSSTALPDEVMLALLGQTGASSLQDAGVEWVHRQTWPNGARVLDRAEPLESTKFARGLFYTGVADDVLTSLESSCQFGRSAAYMANYYARCGEKGCPTYP